MCYIKPVSSRQKQEAAKKPFWQNRVLLICIGLVLIFGAFYYTQQGGSQLAPKPYEYNPLTNKHWDPEHKHWHDGPPPTTSTVTPGTGSQPPLTPSMGAPSTLPTVQTGTTTPKPYEYNPATNQYWDPGHNHWHSGQPPSPDSQKVLNAVPPVMADTTTHKPYEYDAVKNQHWDPNHRHWHSGKPPNQTLIPPINLGGK